MIQHLDLWAAESTSWAFWAEGQALGTRALSKETPPVVGTHQGWKSDLPGKAHAGQCLHGAAGVPLLLGLAAPCPHTWQVSMPPRGEPAHRLWVWMVPVYQRLLFTIRMSRRRTLASCRTSP